MKKALALLLIAACLLSLSACVGANGREVSSTTEVSSEGGADSGAPESAAEPSGPADAEPVSGSVARMGDEVLADLTAEDASALADVLASGAWNEEGTADCLCDCKLVLAGAAYSYHSECGTFNDNANGRSLSVAAQERERVNAILARYVALETE